MERSGLRCFKKTFAHKGSKKRFFLLICFHLFTLFKHLFAPTSKSPMSKLFRYWDSLGKSNGQKWSQIVKLFLINGVKLPPKKSYFFGEFCLTSRIFWYQCYYRHQLSDALSPVCGIFCYLNALIPKHKNFMI